MSTADALPSSSATPHLGGNLALASLNPFVTNVGPVYEVLGAFIDGGDILGHEPMGIVGEIGTAATRLNRGDRVPPFNIACGCSRCRYSTVTVSGVTLP